VKKNIKLIMLYINSTIVAVVLYYSLYMVHQSFGGEVCVILNVRSF